MRLLLFVCTLLLTLPASGADLAIRGARVFDGERVRDGLVVLVSQGRIARLVPTGDYENGGEPVIDAAGHTLLPGLIDCHTHPLQVPDLRQSLVFGVTTSLSMMDRPAFGQDVTARQAKGELLDAADMLCAGNPVTPPGGHGTQYGFVVPTVRGVDAIPAFVAERVKEGSRYIKIMYEHGELYDWDVPGLTYDELKAAVDAAHRHERLAVVHVSSLAEGRDAFRAGADGLVHGWMDRVPSADDLKAPGKLPFVVPTLAVVEGIERKPGDPAPLAEVAAFRPYLVPANLTNLRRSWVGFQLQGEAGLARAKQVVKALHAAGVRILAGSDAPNPGVTHGVSLHRELELLVASGLTPTDALRAATSLPAEAFGLDDRGRIAPGLRADLVLVKGDPTRDVLATREIVRVWKAGAEYDRAVYARAVAADHARLKAIAAPQGLLEKAPFADFEGGRVAARFGAFLPSTDALRGGDSTVRFEVVGDEGQRRLRVSGKVTTTAKPFRWSGVYYAPAAAPLVPANLSQAKGLSFRYRGQGALYVSVLAQRLGMLPVIRRLKPSEDWRTFRATWAELDGLDGTDLTGFIFGADQPGDYWLELDDLRFD